MCLLFQRPISWESKIEAAIMMYRSNYNKANNLLQITTIEVYLASIDCITEYKGNISIQNKYCIYFCIYCRAFHLLAEEISHSSNIG